MSGGQRGESDVPAELQRERQLPARSADQQHLHVVDQCAAGGAGVRPGRETLSRQPGREESPVPERPGPTTAGADVERDAPIPRDNGKTDRPGVLGPEVKQGERAVVPPTELPGHPEYPPGPMEVTRRALLRLRQPDVHSAAD